MPPSTFCFDVFLSLFLSLFPCFTWLHIRLYFLFIFPHMCALLFLLCVFFFFSPFLINSTQLRRLVCFCSTSMMLSSFHMCSRIYTQIFNGFFSFLEKKKNIQKQQNLVQSTNWNSIFWSFFFSIEFKCDSQHNCSMLQN